jgi:hypothetical protein
MQQLKIVNDSKNKEIKNLVQSNEVFLFFTFTFYRLKMLNANQ